METLTQLELQVFSDSSDLTCSSTAARALHWLHLYYCNCFTFLATLPEAKCALTLSWPDVLISLHIFFLLLLYFAQFLPKRH